MGLIQSDKQMNSVCYLIKSHDTVLSFYKKWVVLCMLSHHCVQDTIRIMSCHCAQDLKHNLRIMKT